MKLCVLLLCVFIAGCGGVSGYEPYVQDIVQPAELIKDEIACRDYALAYATPIDLSAIFTSAAQGGANNASGAAINPLVPVLGAAGGATSAALSQLGILNNDQKRIFLRCLEHRGERSRAYNVMDPNF